MKTKAIFLGNSPFDFERVWNEDQRIRLAKVVDLPERLFDDQSLLDCPDSLDDVEAVFSTWGMPLLSGRHLDRLPRLRAVFYAAGSVKEFAAPLFARGVTVVSAAAANAEPVAEFTLSQILFGLKLGWSHIRQLRGLPGPASWRCLDVPGAYESTVGIISLGMIGQKLCELLAPFALRKLAHDPFAGEEVFGRCDARRVGLEELFARSEVVTLQAPLTEETEGMVTGELLASLPPDATFINTARGALVREKEMIEVLGVRSDLTAVLDVTNPEPPPPGSPLYDLPNVVLTPHIAGSAGREVRRMADLMVQEFEAWRNGGALRHAVTPDQLAIGA